MTPACVKLYICVKPDGRKVIFSGARRMGIVADEGTAAREVIRPVHAKVPGIWSWRVTDTKEGSTNGKGNI